MSHRRNFFGTVVAGVAAIALGRKAKGSPAADDLIVSVEVPAVGKSTITNPRALVALPHGFECVRLHGTYSHDELSHLVAARAARASSEKIDRQWREMC